MAIEFTPWDGPQSPHYTFGFVQPLPSSHDEPRRAELFDAYAAGLPGTFRGLFGMPAHDAWVEANEILEGSGIDWAYRRETSPTRNTYWDRLRGTESTDLGSERTFFTARGSC